MDMSGKVHVTDVTSKEKKIYADIDIEMSETESEAHGLL